MPTQRASSDQWAEGRRMRARRPRARATVFQDTGARASSSRRLPGCVARCLTPILRRGKRGVRVARSDLARAMRGRRGLDGCGGGQAPGARGRRGTGRQAGARRQGTAVEGGRRQRTTSCGAGRAAGRPGGCGRALGLTLGPGSSRRGQGRLAAAKRSPRGPEAKRETAGLDACEGMPGRCRPGSSSRPVMLNTRATTHNAARTATATPAPRSTWRRSCDSVTKTG